jgi:hypothetical protein
MKMKNKEYVDVFIKTDSIRPKIRKKGEKQFSAF